MTYREKLAMEHPGLRSAKINMVGCPHMYGYCSKEQTLCGQGIADENCAGCWDQEIPETPTEEKTVNEQRAEAGLEPINDIPYIKDSGNRREFASGAVRDMQEGKGRCDLMPLEVAAKWLEDDILGCIADFKNQGDATFLYSALNYFSVISYPDKLTLCLEVAKHFEEGAKKYGENNWQKGIPTKCYIDSAVRHYLKWLRGDKDEPHDRAFVWNLMCCIWEVDYRHEEES